MKYFFYLFLLYLTCTLGGCDDGKIDVVSFDFTGVAAKSCNLGKFFLFSTKENRTFILEIDETNFKNLPTAQNTPIIVPISGNTRLTYREYNGPVQFETLCSSPPDISLITTKEWTATGGTVEITTTAAVNENTSTNASTITGFNHTIVFKNISFNTGGVEQKNDVVQFGIYNKANANTLRIDSALTPTICGTTISKLFKFSGNQTLTLAVDPTIFSTTILNTPKVRPINGTNNNLEFRVLNIGSTILTNNYFCITPAPLSNIELWTAQVTGGSISVVSENVSGGFKHTITILNCTMENQGLKFRLGTEYLFGVYQTN